MANRLVSVDDDFDFPAPVAARQAARLGDATTPEGGEVTKIATASGTKALTDAKTYADSVKTKRGAVPSGDLDALRTPGVYHLAVATHASNPAPGLFGTVTVKDFAPFSSALEVTFVTWEKVPRTLTRIFTGSLWEPWSETPSLSQVEAIAASGRPVSGTKIVPLAITAGQGAVTERLPNHSARWVRRYSVAPTRIRLHIANRNPGPNTIGGQASLTGIWVSKGTAEGATSQTRQALGATTLPADGSEVVTPWTECPALDGEYVAISLGWTAATDANIVIMQGGGWVANNSSAATAASIGAGWTRRQATPFHVWIEAEVPAITPVICGHGDSITIGTSTTDPVGDSFVAIHAYEHGALPVILAEHGSSMPHWAAASRRWEPYAGMKLSRIVDATITTLGQNDLETAGTNLTEMQSRHRTLMGALNRLVGGPIYTGFITPSTKSSEVEATRKAYNAWLATLPTGARGIFDFAAAVGAADGETLAPEYSADGLHPNTAGQRVMANVVAAKPVVPYMLSPSKLKALAALL